MTAKYSWESTPKAKVGSWVDGSYCTLESSHDTRMVEYYMNAYRKVLDRLEYLEDCEQDEGVIEEKNRIIEWLESHDDYLR